MKNNVRVCVHDTVDDHSRAVCCCRCKWCLGRPVIAWTLILKMEDILQSLISMSHHGNWNGRTAYIPLWLIFTLNRFCREQAKLLWHRVVGKNIKLKHTWTDLEVLIWETMNQSLTFCNSDRNTSERLVCYTAGSKLCWWLLEKLSWMVFKDSSSFFAYSVCIP